MNKTSKIAGKITINGQEITVLEGDTLGTCLVRQGILTLRYSLTGEPRGMFCGIGICHDCLVTVDGKPNVRACMTLAIPGISVQTNKATK
jgi:predicted molibdopterin-dependent oxidoreductase YjgC